MEFMSSLDFLPIYDVASSPVYAPPHLQELVQMPYRHPRHAVLRPGEIAHYTFSCGGVPGANLADAFEGRLAALDAPDELLLPADARKVATRIHMEGHALFRRTKNTQHVCRGVPVPVPRRRVVQCVAEAARLFVAQAPELALGPAAMFGVGAIELRDMYLLALDRYGRTLVPVFGYMPWSDQVALPAEGGSQNSSITTWDAFTLYTQSQ